MKVKLLRDLDGKRPGDVADYPKQDAIRLEKAGAVAIMGGAPTPGTKARVGAPSNKATGGTPDAS